MTHRMVKVSTSLLLELKAFLFQNGIHDMTPYQGVLIYHMRTYPLYLRQSHVESDEQNRFAAKLIQGLVKWGCIIEIEQNNAFFCRLTPTGEAICEKISVFFEEKNVTTYQHGFTLHAWHHILCIAL